MAKSRTLRSWLLWIILSVQGALILAALVLLHRTWDLQRDRIREELQRTAGTLAASIDRSLEQHASELLALTHNLPANEEAAGEELHKRAELLIDSTSIWTSLALNDGSGKQRWNTALPGPATAPSVARTHNEEVLRTRKPYVSDVFEGRMTRRKLVAVAVPVQVGSQSLVLAGTLDLQRLSTWFQGSNMAGASVGGLLDRQLRFVTRTLRSDELAGKQPSEEWLQALKRSPERGVIRLQTLEGVTSYSAWSRLPCGWTVGIAVPAAPLEQDLYRSLATFLGWALVMLIAGGVLTYTLGIRLLRDVEDLRRRALALGEGVKPQREFEICDFDVIGQAMQEADDRLVKSAQALQDEIAVKQEALEQSQRRLTELNAVLEAVPAPIFIARDAECRVVEGNPSAYRLLNVPPGTNLSQTGDGQGARLQLLIDGMPADLSQLPMRRAAAGDTVEGAGFTARLPDGTERHLFGNATPILAPQGGPVGAVGAFADITDQLKTQEQLARSRLELQTIADHSPDVIVRFDRELRHVYVNAAIQRITGLSPEDIIGKSNRELGMEPMLCDRWDATLNALFETGEPQRVEFSFVNQQGELREFLGRFVAEFDDTGRVVHALGVVHDRTAEVRHAQALASDVERRSLFIANFSHELRNPLNTLHLGLQVLRLTPVNERAGKTLAGMERQLNHIVRLLDDLLEASRAGAGKLSISKAPVVLQDVISDALMGVSSSAHRISVESPEVPVSVLGDATRLLQVVSNLIGNSIKYSPAGGDITVTLAIVDDQAELRVRDEGIGIPTNQLEAVFEPFSQIAEHREHAQGGMGLGLAIVRQIVLLHDGTVRAASDGTHGTEMIVRIPLNNAPDAR